MLLTRQYSHGVRFDIHALTNYIEWKSTLRSKSLNFQEFTRMHFFIALVVFVEESLMATFSCSRKRQSELLTFS